MCMFAHKDGNVPCLNSSLNWDNFVLAFISVINRVKIINAVEIIFV